jgi:hypothetical protein
MQNANNTNRSSVVSVLFSLISETFLRELLRLSTFWIQRGPLSLLMSTLSVASIALPLADANLFFISRVCLSQTPGEESSIATPSIQTSDLRLDLEISTELERGVRNRWARLRRDSQASPCWLVYNRRSRYRAIDHADLVATLEHQTRQRLTVMGTTPSTKQLQRGDRDGSLVLSKPDFVARVSPPFIPLHYTTYRYSGDLSPMASRSSSLYCCLTSASLI